MAIALGWLVGQAIVMFAAYFLMAHVGASAIKPAAVTMLAVGCAAFAWMSMRSGRVNHAANEPCEAELRMAAQERTPWTALERVLLGVLMVSIGVKALSMAASIAWNPGRCEDALAYWLFKAKSVTLLGQVPLSPDDPFYLGGSNPKYPIYPSMIAAWIPLVVGEWHETLSVLPWLMTFVMLPVLAASILPNRTPRLIRLMAAYLIGSLPLAAIHVLRPGYVDLILASFLMGALGLVLQCREQPRRGTLLLATLLFIAAACTKREGAMAVAAVLATLVPFALFKQRQTRGIWKPLPSLLATAAVTGIVVFLLMDLSDVSSDAGRWAYHPEAWAAIWRHAVEWSSFSFFFPLVLVVAATMLVLRRDANACLTFALCLALFGYAVSPFLLTDNVRFALNDQTPSRLLLQIAPAIVIALAYGIQRETTCPAPTN